MWRCIRREKQWWKFNCTLFFSCCLSFRFSFGDHVTLAFYLFFCCPVSQLLSPWYSSLRGVQRAGPQIPHWSEEAGSAEGAQSQVLPFIASPWLSRRDGELPGWVTAAFPQSYLLHWTHQSPCMILCDDWLLLFYILENPGAKVLKCRAKFKEFGTVPRSAFLRCKDFSLLPAEFSKRWKFWYRCLNFKEKNQKVFYLHWSINALRYLTDAIFKGTVE